MSHYFVTGWYQLILKENNVEMTSMESIKKTIFLTFNWVWDFQDFIVESVPWSSASKPTKNLKLRPQKAYTGKLQALQPKPAPVYQQSKLEEPNVIVWL